MKIINTGVFYAPNEIDTSGTVYRGIIKLSKKEFTTVIKKALNAKRFKGLVKEMLVKDLARSFTTKKKTTVYALRVSISEYIAHSLKNKSRYNYLIEVI